MNGDKKTIAKAEMYNGNGVGGFTIIEQTSTSGDRSYYLRSVVMHFGSSLEAVMDLPSKGLLLWLSEACKQVAARMPDDMESDEGWSVPACTLPDDEP